MGLKSIKLLHNLGFDFVCNVYIWFHGLIIAPTLVETIKLRMFEMGLTQAKLAEMLGLSTARVSEIISGKGDPSLKTGREISRKLNIDPAIVLGV